MISIGSKVEVLSSNKYNGRIKGMTGIVANIFNPKRVSYSDYYDQKRGRNVAYDSNQKIGVKVDDLSNPFSNDGLFWFNEEDLAVIFTSDTCFGLSVQKVIFNNPKTIVFWSDGSKTIVSCREGDTFDNYAGFCAAVTKKILGSTSHAKKILNDKESIPKNGA